MGTVTNATASGTMAPNTLMPKLVLSVRLFMNPCGAQRFA
jgi:hypothetical protein